MSARQSEIRDLDLITSELEGLRVRLLGIANLLVLSNPSNDEWPMETLLEAFHGAGEILRGECEWIDRVRPELSEHALGASIQVK